MGCDGLAVLIVIELIFCSVCLIYKRVTDDTAYEIYIYREKFSREWRQINFVTRNNFGSLFADAAFGGFTIITLGRLIAHLCGELKKARILNCFFLVVGCTMFLIVGAYILTAVDYLPHELVTNAIILGVISIITGILFLVDLGIIGNRTRQETKRVPKVTLSEPIKEEKDKKKKKVGNGVLKDLKSSFRKKKKDDVIETKTVEFKEEVKEKEDSKPVGREREDSPALERGFDDTRQYGRRKMENRGFIRESPDGLVRPRTRWDDEELRNWQYRSELDDRYDRRFSKRMEIELEEEYLRPPDQYRYSERELQDHRITSSRHDLSDDDGSLQIPSVSFLMSERGKKVMPSLSTSPVERIQDVGISRPRYYFNSSRDREIPPPPSPVQPGYVRRTASKLSETAPKTTPTTVSDRLQNWFNSRPSKPPP